MEMTVSEYIKNQMLNRMAGLIRRVRALDEEGNVLSDGWRSVNWSPASQGVMGLSSSIDIHIAQLGTVYSLEFEESHQGLVVDLPEPVTFTKEHNYLRITSFLIELDV